MRKVVRLKKLSVKWEQALEEFLLHKKAEGRAARTLFDYKARITPFFQAYPEAWPDYEALRRAVRLYLAQFTGKAPASYNLPLQYLRSFFSWCMAENMLHANPTEGIAKRKDEGKAREIPEDTLKNLLALPDRRTYAGIRDYALILLQVDTGIRPGEALNLKPSDFNIPQLEVVIPRETAKTRTQRTAVYSPVTAKAIKRLLDVRPPDWNDSVPVFASQDGKRMLETSWANRLRAYGKRIGADLQPYMLRHTSAIMALRNGATAFFVQKQLGHSDMQMTKRYCRLVEEDMHREHSIASPVGSLIQTRAVKPKESKRRK
ncbi:MAG: site-specific integrase [Pelotomaculum sp.]|uniref:Site-specific recombinase XerD n=1 Tax=Pelotomaculum thermopropionicum (strain DSM 13744 / JCM 10971 / SI) TaxID=370438 RepID=A5D2G0_PELTS|nr:site-specific integrase [Pelotomaculum sp.]BAF59572.1 site-specific recombinase XerD [Pelotomaculum thermopropionicum SI]